MRTGRRARPSRQRWTFESEPRLGAFLLGLHPRVGAHSRLRTLPAGLPKRIAKYFLVPRAGGRFDTVRAR